MGRTLARPRRAISAIVALGLAFVGVTTAHSAYADADEGESVIGSSDNGDGTYDNPMIWADVPDTDVIRVGDAFYMSSTTMHMNPGVRS